MKLLKKILILVIWIAAVILVSVYLAVPSRQKLSYGVTYSQKFAEELQLDTRKFYADILDDLKIRNMRLIAYWDKIEPEEGKFDFRDLDWQVDEAGKRGVRIILAVGRKTPRWPECHIPGWAKSHPQFSDKLLNYIKTTVEHYKASSAITAWQVENEPLFPFGECGTAGLAQLDKEIKLIRSLDKRPVLLTDAGELGFMWPYLSVKGDIFGTTLYRYVHNRVLGDIRYSLIPAISFRAKAWWARYVLGKEILISELQAEPWSPVSLFDASYEDQAKTMSPEKLREVVEYAERSGFPVAYFWGVEWWYWLKDKKGRPEMWDTAKELINSR